MRLTVNGQTPRRGLPPRTSSLRGLGTFGNVFATESLLDELARAAEMDPIALRRALVRRSCTRRDRSRTRARR